MDLDIIPAGAADAATLQNLIQLYTHDFSEFWAGTARGELSVDGRFPDYRLEPFFTRPGWRALLLTAGAAPAGFALINDQAHSGHAAEHAMAEFFVVRKHRGRGLGGQVARRLIGGAPGVWEVAVARRNLAALAFWRRVAADCAGPGGVAELDLDGPDWNGPALRFTVD
ncbi:GNAT family N-acetyltransferase [Phenylobacterium sp.]|uniref:GNAT family N-acetyltransferase n=1 Tax=Phenylobacterium sp. TaxID=1871053 RepID=UPI00289708AA|nr:GNAT family N-acetyltransferase [Phenylobacterium sp.]